MIPAILTPLLSQYPPPPVAQFMHLTQSPTAGSAGAAISGRMRERAEARQRSRLNKAIEMMATAPLQQMRFKRGQTLYAQGEEATHFYIVKSGQLKVTFTSTNGETAELGSLSQGDQFGYDAVLGELHDTTVSCLTDCEVFAVPREQLQKAFTQDSYLQSVWQAPAKRSLQLRRQRSQELNADWLEKLKAAGAGADAAAAAAAADAAASGREGGGARQNLRKYVSSSFNPADMRLPKEEFDPLLRRARAIHLSSGELAFEQGSQPAAVYLLREGECVVEHTGKTTGTAVIGRLSSGDHFGEGAVMEGRDRRNCSVRCVSAAGCALGVLGKGAFEAILRAEPSLQSTFEQALERRNRQRLRSMVTLAAEQSDCTTREVKKGEVVFSQGEPAESFFLVDRGAVQMSYRTADGRQLPSKTHRAGDAFGASGLLVGMSSATRRDTAIALVDTTLKVIPHARFGTLMRQDSMLAEGLRRACSTAPTGGGGGGSGAGGGGAGRAPLRGQPTTTQRRSVVGR